MIITAKFASTCSCCRQPIAVGSKIEWSKGSPAQHESCARTAGAGVIASAPVARSTYRRSYGRRAPGAGSAPSVAGYSSWCTARPGCRCYDCAS
jgi:hypothetical protein